MRKNVKILFYMIHLMGNNKQQLNINRPIVQVIRILSSALPIKEDIADLFFHTEEEGEQTDGQLKFDFHFINNI